MAPGAPYIPELRKYLVETRPNGELVDEVDVYGIELIQPGVEFDRVRKLNRYLRFTCGALIVTVLVLLLSRK